VAPIAVAMELPKAEEAVDIRLIVKVIIYEFIITADTTYF
jgi:hypothetical protein